MLVDIIEKRRAKTNNLARIIEQSIIALFRAYVVNCRQISRRWLLAALDALQVHECEIIKIGQVQRVRMLVSGLPILWRL